MIVPCLLHAKDGVYPMLRVSQWAGLSLVPRTVAYSVAGIAVLTLLSTDRPAHWLWPLALYFLSFPWLLHAWLRRGGEDTRDGTDRRRGDEQRWLRAQLLENSLTGFAAGAAAAPWILCVGVSACLMMANAALGGSALFWRALTVLLVALGSGFYLSGGGGFQSSNWLCDALSGGLIMWFGAVVGFRGFEQAQRIHEGKTVLAQKSHELELLTARLATYLPQQLCSSSIDRPHGRTERKWLTVLFVDIAGFTRLTELLDPEHLRDLLNEYLQAMTAVVRGHGGTVDKFIGDAVMVFFGDPESLGPREDALCCARMALQMRERFASLRERWQARCPEAVFDVRIGMDSGLCHVGDFGSGERFDYTAVGRPVNLASRLERAARPQQILMSRSAWELVKDEITCEFVRWLRVKGMAQSVEAFACNAVRVPVKSFANARG